MRRLIKFFTNKFFIATAIFVVWMLFFDQNDWFTQHEKKQELAETKENIKFLNHEIDQINQQYLKLKTDPATLEKFAREHYRMKKDSEDLYIIEHK